MPLASRSKYILIFMKSYRFQIKIYITIRNVRPLHKSKKYESNDKSYCYIHFKTHTVITQSKIRKKKNKTDGHQSLCLSLFLAKNLIVLEIVSKIWFSSGPLL